MSEILTVRNSTEDRVIEIEGTIHALSLTRDLITSLLEHPEDKTVTAYNPTSGVSVVIRLVD